MQEVTVLYGGKWIFTESYKCLCWSFWYFWLYWLSAKATTLRYRTVVAKNFYFFSSKQIQCAGCLDFSYFFYSYINLGVIKSSCFIFYVCIFMTFLILRLINLEFMNSSWLEFLQLPPWPVRHVGSKSKNSKSWIERCGSKIMSISIFLQINLYGEPLKLEIKKISFLSHSRNLNFFHSFFWSKKNTK